MADDPQRFSFLGRLIALAGDEEPAFRLADWSVARRYSGPPPELEWVVEGLIPAGCPGMLAASGGVGKSFALLDLALQVARGSGSWFGHPIRKSGPAVVITAEDAADTVHRRLAALDPSGSAAQLPLYVVPLASLERSWSLVTGGGPAGFVRAGSTHLEAELLALPAKPALVVIDPLQAVAQVDINSAPDAAQYVCTTLARIASATGAAVVVSHHLRKTSQTQSAQEAREAIRGTSAIVDGLRYAIAMWPADDSTAEHVCQRLGVLRAGLNQVIRAAVVKSNEPCAQEIRILLRDTIGVLRDVTDAVEGPRTVSPELRHALVRAIRVAAEAGQPFARRPRHAAGLWSRLEELPELVRALPLARLEQAVSQLLLEGEIVQATAGRSATRWLDVPGGPFARGVGELQPGSIKAEEEEDHAD